VASRDGLQINQHLREAASLRIYRADERGFGLVGIREVSRDAEGLTRWLRMADLLLDCIAVLVSGAGPLPCKILAHYGILVGIVEGSVQKALRMVASGGDLSFTTRQNFHCGAGKCREDRTGRSAFSHDMFILV
jgi:nitrogen fixation protein NifB